MGLNALQFIVVFLAATASLTFANHDGRQITEVDIEGEIYCSSDGNQQRSSRRLSNARVSLSCDEGETILFETTTRNDGEFEMEIENQVIVGTILANESRCAIFVRLPVAGCLLTPSNGYSQAYLDPNVNYIGSHAKIRTLLYKFVSCIF